MIDSDKARLRKPTTSKLFPSKQLLSQDGYSVVTGEKFSASDPCSNSTFNFDFSDFPASDEIAAACYRTVCRYLTTKSLHYSYASLLLFRDMLSAAAEDVKPVEQIDLSSLESWRRAREARGVQYGTALAFVLPFLRRWVEWGETGVSEELSLYLMDKDGRVEAPAYVSLRTNDPERGALTHREMNALTAELNAKFETGTITLEAYALMWLFIGTGVRPIQITRMRVADIVDEYGAGANDMYLSIPLAKGRGPYDGDRWKLRAPTVLAEVLREYIGHYGLVEAAAPLFPMKTNPSLPASSGALTATVSKVGELLNVFSPRVDGPIPLFPYRFRYTVGNRTVELGANDHVVARILTHRSTYSAKSYRAATAGGQKAVMLALGDELDVIAKAFRGKLITDFSDATRSGEAMALIRDFERLSGRKMGACGTRAACLQHAPIACLNCWHFEAFEDAPFEELRTQLVAEQNDEAEIKIKQIYDEPIAALDELIQLRQLDTSRDGGVKQ